jgi:hypothetical protein
LENAAAIAKTSNACQRYDPTKRVFGRKLDDRVGLTHRRDNRRASNRLQSADHELLVFEQNLAILFVKLAALISAAVNLARPGG